MSARVRPGHDVSVVDVSAGGALVECTHRMLPGAAVDLQLRVKAKKDAQKDGTETELVRGRVLRCAVCRVRPNVICYRGAIVFDRWLPWFLDDRDGYGVPDAEHRLARDSWGRVTPQLI